MKRTKFVPVVLVCGMALVLAGIAPPTASAAPIVSTIETRLTTSLGDEYDPSISGDLVVYTSNRNTHTDVFYYDLATSTEHQVTATAGNQELTDVWGSTIAYSDLAKLDVMLFDIPSGVSTNLTND
jgi:beta propeller repeat protein